MSDSTLLELPEMLDTQAAPALLRSLQSLRGSDVRIEAASVRRIGGLCLQILLAASTAWLADGLTFTCSDISPELAAGFELFGVTGNFPN